MEKFNRKSERNKTYAKVLLSGSGILGYLRDLSKEGCQLAFIGKPQLDKGSAAKVEVLPDEQMNIPRFSMDLQIMWSKIDPVYYICGGLITSVGDQESFQKLFSYYA